MGEKQRSELVDVKNKKTQELLDALCEGVIDLETYMRAVDLVYAAKSVEEVVEVINAIFEERQLSPF